MSNNLKFIDDLKVAIEAKKLAEKSPTNGMMKEAKVIAHQEKEKQFAVLQQKFNETLDESLIAKMQGLREDMQKIDIQKVESPYVSVDNDVCKELAEELAQLGLFKKAARIAELREAYLGAIQEHNEALEVVRSNVTKLELIATKVEPQIVKKALDWYEKTYSSISIGDRERAELGYRLEKLTTESHTTLHDLMYRVASIKKEEAMKANK